MILCFGDTLNPALKVARNLREQPEGKAGQVSGRFARMKTCPDIQCVPSCCMTRDTVSNPAWVKYSISGAR